MRRASPAEGRLAKEGWLSREMIAAATTGVSGLFLMGIAPTSLLPVGAVLLSVALWVAPALACPAIVLTLPFYLHPRLLAGQEISVTEIVIGLSVAATAGRALAQRRRSRSASTITPGRVQPAKAHGLDWLVAGFLLAALLSLLVTEYPKQSTRELRWLVVEPLLVLYLARATLLTPADLRLLLGSIVAAGVVASAVAWLSLAGSRQILAIDARVTAPFLSPNHLGLFLGRAGSVALAWALFGQYKAAPAGALALIGLTVLRTISLGAWLGLGASVAALAAMRSSRLLWITLGSFLVVLAASLTVLPPERTWGRLDPARGTGLLRLQLWDSSIRMVSDHPLLGIGLDNFLYRYRSTYIRDDAWEEPNLSHPHNWVLHFWLQLGVFGLAVFGATVVWIARRSLRALRLPRGPTERLVGAAVLAMLIDCLVHGLVDNSYFLVDAAVLFWLGAALLVVLDQSPSDLLEGQ